MAELKKAKKAKEPVHEVVERTEQYCKFCSSLDKKLLALYKSGWCPLSNFSIAPFTINGVTYNCVEQWYQSEKAKYFGDQNAYRLIMQSKSPKWQKYYGERLRWYDEQTWKQVADNVVETGIRAKAEQNDNFKAFLKDTGSAIVGEATKFDCYWGIGIDLYDQNICDLSRWYGENRMGKILMKVRDAIL